MPETDFHIECTTSSGSARGQAHEIAQSCEVVAAAGGDGTVGDVMQGILGSKTALAVLPLGTGNDFARSIGVHRIESAIAAIAANQRKRVDVGHWHQGAREGHFLNVAGCGFDAVVASRINTGFKRLKGSLAYVAAVISTLLSYRASTLTIVVDGERFQVRAMLCAIANARCYGGGMMIAPCADIADGFLDLVIVEEISRIGFLLAFPKVFKGKHMTHPKVMHRTFKSIEISSDPPVPFLVDGELFDAGPVRIEVVPSVLDVLVPQVTEVSR